MKKILILGLLLVTLFIGCANTEEEKSSPYVEEECKDMDGERDLCYATCGPKDYDCVDTCDSQFNNITDSSGNYCQ